MKLKTDPLASHRIVQDMPPPRITKSEPTPWAHQREAYHLAREHEGYLLAHQMGCGKSRTAIDIIQNDEPGAILVTCPKAVVATWPHEVLKHAVEPWPVVALRDGTVSMRCKMAAEALRRYKRRRVMIVCNYDIVHRAQMASLIRENDWQAIVCDESHRIKSPMGRQSKAMAAFAPKARRRLLLTGTPIPHTPLDLFGQFRFLDHRVFGKHFAAFRARYALCNPQFPSQVRRWLNLDELAEKFYSRAHRVMAEDVLDLPDKVDTVIPVTLGKTGRKIYDTMRDEFVAELETAGGPEMISASNALVKLLRLQQITGGSLPSESGEPHEIDDAKLLALTDLVEDLGGETVVVFARFRADLDQVRRVAEKLKLPFGELSGRVNDLDGNQLPDRVRGGLFAVQIQSGGSGVDLTAASCCVYWSLGYSLGEYEQSVARLHRPGQTRTTRYWHLVAEDTVDEAVYHALRDRAEVVGRVLRSF